MLILYEGTIWLTWWISWQQTFLKGKQELIEHELQTVTNTYINVYVFLPALMNEQAVVHVPTSLCPGPRRQTALHRAAMVGNSDGLAALIQGGCALDLQDRVSDAKTDMSFTQLQENPFMYKLTELL